MVNGHLEGTPTSAHTTVIRDLIWLIVGGEMRCLPHSNRKRTHGPVEGADAWFWIAEAAAMLLVSWGGPSMGADGGGKERGVNEGTVTQASVNPFGYSQGRRDRHVTDLSCRGLPWLPSGIYFCKESISGNRDTPSAVFSFHIVQPPQFHPESIPLSMDLSCRFR